MGNKIEKIIISVLLVTLCIQVLLNLISVFSPEIGFDALWYHLTLPKLWLLKREWYFPGGLLYYSVMPRLTETLYIPLIKIFGFVGPKLLQFASGLTVSYFIWKICNHLKISFLMSIMAVSLFYSTWIVSWESGSGYIDLFRSALETIALYFLIKNKKITGGLFLGLAVGTKWLALLSLGIYAFVFGSAVILPAAIVSLPWFLIAYHFTGNPIFPLFSGIIQNSFNSLSTVLNHVFLIFYHLSLPFDDFISPIISVVFLLSLFSLFSKQISIRKISLVAILGVFTSQVLDPPSSRFLLPYLPLLSVSAVALVDTQTQFIKRSFVFLVILSALCVVILRLIAVTKYLPYLQGKISLNNFLSQYSSKLPGTFIDSDGFVERNIPSDSKIIINRLHNLYYFPYNYDHSSWADPNKKYDYLITKDEYLSSESGKLINTNKIGIQVYKLTK